MKRFTVLTSLILLSSLSLPTVAQVYQWKDANGKTVISDSPPPRSARDNRSVDTGPASPPPPAPNSAAGGKSLAERNLEFKQRRQTNAEAAEKESKDAAAAQARRDNCQRAQRYSAALDSGARIAQLDEKGNRQAMDESDKQRERERTQAIIEENCK